MASVSIEVNGDTEIANSLELAASTLAAKTFGVVNTWGMALRTKVLANASGRPGPRHVTGDYKRSWSTRSYIRGGDVVSEVGTNAPQGPRLEYGFTGQDALGRHYNQPPYPHARPALDAVEAGFLAAIEAATGLV